MDRSILMGKIVKFPVAVTTQTASETQYGLCPMLEATVRTEANAGADAVASDSAVRAAIDAFNPSVEAVSIGAGTAVLNTVIAGNPNTVTFNSIAGRGFITATAQDDTIVLGTMQAGYPESASPSAEISLFRTINGGVLQEASTVDNGTFSSSITTTENITAGIPVTVSARFNACTIIGSQFANTAPTPTNNNVLAEGAVYLAVPDGTYRITYLNGATKYNSSYAYNQPLTTNQGMMYCNNTALPGYTASSGYSTLTAAQAAYTSQYVTVTVSGGVGLYFWFNATTNTNCSGFVQYMISAVNLVSVSAMMNASNGYNNSNTWTSTTYVPAALSDTNIPGGTEGPVRVAVPDGTYRVTYVNGGVTYHSYSAGPVDVTDGLVAQWMLNGDTTDSQGVRNATNVGVTFTYESIFSRSAGVFGGSGWAYFSQSGVPLVNTARSICGWMKISSSYGGSGGYATVFSMGTYGSSGYTDHGFALSVDSGYLSAQFGNSYHNYTAYNKILTDSTWHHVAMTWSGSTVILYIDGVAYLSVARSAINTVNGYGYGSIGTMYDGANGPQYTLLGELADWRLYNRVLTASDVANIMTYDTTSSGSGTVADPYGMWNVPFSTYAGSNPVIAAFPNGGKVFCNQTELQGFSNVAGYSSVVAAQQVYAGQYTDVIATNGLGLNFWYGDVTNYGYDNRGRITYSIAKVIPSTEESYDAFYDVQGGDAIGKIMMKCTTPFTTTNGSAKLSVGIEGESSVNAWPTTVTINPVMDCCKADATVWTNGVPPIAVDDINNIATGAFKLDVPDGTYRITYAAGAVWGAGVVSTNPWNQTVYYAQGYAYGPTSGGTVYNRSTLAACWSGAAFVNGTRLPGFNGGLVGTSGVNQYTQGYATFAAAQAANVGSYIDFTVTGGTGLWFYFTDLGEGNYHNEGYVSYTVFPLSYTGSLDMQVSVSAAYNLCPTVSTSYKVQPSYSAIGPYNSTGWGPGSLDTPLTTDCPNIPGATHVPVSDGIYRITYVDGAVNYDYSSWFTTAGASSILFNIPFSAFLNDYVYEYGLSSMYPLARNNEGRMYCNATPLPGFDYSYGFSTVAAAANYYSGDYIDITVTGGDGLWFYYADSSGKPCNNMGRISYKITQITDDTEALVESFDLPTTTGLVTPTYGTKLYDKVQYFDAAGSPDKDVEESNSISPGTAIKVYKSGTGVITGGELKVVVFYDKSTPYGYIMGTVDRQIDKFYLGTDLVRNSSRDVYNYGQVSFYGSVGNESQGTAYLGGGKNSVSTVNAVIQRSVASTDTVTPIVRSQLTSARSNLHSFKSSSSAYFVGGLTTSSPTYAIDKLGFANDTSAVTSAANLSTALYGVASASDGNGGMAYFCGGRNASYTTDVVSKMLPSSDTIMGLSSVSLTQARYNAATGSDSTSVYVVNGRDSSTSSRYSNVDKINTFADTGAASWASPTALDGQGVIGTSQAMYLVGGADSSLEYGFITKLNFSDSTVSFVSQIAGTTYGGGGATITRR